MFDQCDGLKVQSCKNVCNIPRKCVEKDVIICGTICKCDEACIFYGDCCLDYWKYCRNDSLILKYGFGNEQFKRMAQKLNEFNTSLSSMLKYVIIKLYRYGDYYVNTIQ